MLKIALQNGLKLLYLLSLIVYSVITCVFNGRHSSNTLHSYAIDNVLLNSSSIGDSCPSSHSERLQ